MSEKRHFKLTFSNKADEQKPKEYMLLFESFDKLKTFDKEALEKNLKQNGINKLITGNLSYLYQLILKTLNIYHQKNNLIFKVRNYLNNVEVLVSKDLIDLAEKELKKAKKIIVDYDLQSFKTQLLLFEKQFAFRNSNQLGDFKPEELQAFDNKEKEVIEELIETNHFSTTTDRILNLISSKTTKYDTEQIDKWINKYANPIENGSDSFNHCIWYLSMYSSYSLLKNNYSNYNYFNSQLIQLWQKHPQIIKRHFSNFLTVYNNYLNGLFLSKKHDELFVEFDNFKQLPKKYSIERKSAYNHINRTYLVLSMAALNSTNQYQKVKETLPEALKAIEKHELSELYQKIIFFNALIATFSLGEYDEALDYIEKVLGERKSLVRQDLTLYAYLLKLIVHLEIDSIDLLPYLITNTKRKLDKESPLYTVNKKLIELVNNLVKSQIDNKEQQTLLQQFKSEIDLNNKKYDHTAIAFLTLVDKWVEGRLA